MLPYTVEFEPYTTSHVLTQLQLLFFAMLAFALLVRTGLYPVELPSLNLNTDWIYRRALPRLYAWLLHFGTQLRTNILARLQRRLERFISQVYRHHGPEGAMARTWTTGDTVLWVALLLGGYLIVYFV